MRSLYLFLSVSLWTNQPCWLLGAPPTNAVVKARLPLHFEPNMGQVKGRTEWIVQARGAAVYITGSEVVFALGGDNAHMKFLGARSVKGNGIDPLGGYSNYFLGKTEKSWFTGVPHYGSVRYANVYPGIDVVYHSSDGKVEYDFVLAPGADPNQIELAFDRDVHISDDGDLILAGLRQHRPRVMQDGHEVASRYEVTGPRRVHIMLTHYGRTSPLTIDPVLEFSTYLGGPGNDIAETIALDSSGNIFLDGNTQTPAAPTLDPFQQPNQIVWQPFLMKLSPDGQKILFFSVFTSGYGTVNNVRVDSGGNIVMTGSTYSYQFPLKNPFEIATSIDLTAGFVAKLTPDGRSFVFSSYLGGYAGTVRIDTDDNIYVVGAGNGDFPLKNALQPRALGGIDCTITRITPAGALVFSTFFGICGDLELAKDDSFWISGGTHSTELTLVNPIQTAAHPTPISGVPCLAKISKDGQRLLYSTYIGGDSFVGSATLRLDDDQNLYLFGGAGNAFLTLKDPFQTTWTSDRQGFLMKLDPSGRNIIFSTYTPGYGSIAVDKAHNIYLAGTAFFADFPQKDSLTPFLGGGPLYDRDAYLMKFAPSGKTLIYSTLLAGSDRDEAYGLEVDDAGNAYVTGLTQSRDFPVKNAYQSKLGGGQDIFLLKISDNSASSVGPLETSPSRTVFQYIQGGLAPASQLIAVTGTEQYFVTTNATWLNAMPTGSPAPPNNVQISVNPGSLAPGTFAGAVTIHPQSGSQVTTVDITLTVYAPPAVISSIQPALVPIGTDDTVITVHGSGFLPGASIYVSGIKWTDSPINVVDAQTITFKMPKVNFSGLISYPITVLNPQSAQSNSVTVSVGNPAPAFTAASVLNAASYAPAPVSVGEIVVVFGSDFGSISTTQVLFDSNPAKIIYLTPTQLAATVPVTAGNGQTTSLQVQTSHDVYSAPVALPLAPAAPGLFTADASGKGQVAAINQDNSVNGIANPAPVGTVVALYATGGGTLTKDALPRLSLPVTATIGGIDSQVLYAGVAPGEPDGMIQLNVVVPSGLNPGNAELLVSVGGISSQKSVTVAVK
jgi:uncharacterized protein (TIGR03437 family)